MVAANGIAMANKADALESVLLQGDLSKLNPTERVNYYVRVCESLGLNPLTKPFEYLTLSGKTVLYARRDCTEQLRKRDGVSVRIVGREVTEGIYVVTAQATLPDKRTDESIGAVHIDGLKGEARANAMMKAETKAKRRVTLAICGLGMLDETEVDSIPGAVHHETNASHVTPVTEPAKPAPAIAPAPATTKPGAPTADDFVDVLKDGETLPELAREWEHIPTQFHKALSPVKDALKARFAAADKAATEPNVIGRELAQMILNQLSQLGVDWGEVTNDTGAGAGLSLAAGFTPMLDIAVTQLTPKQGMDLHAELKRRLAEKKAGKVPVPS